MIFQRKQVVVLSLVLILLIVGYMQYTYNGEYTDWENIGVNDRRPGEASYVENGGDDPAETFISAIDTNQPNQGALRIGNDYFSNAKFERDRQYAESLEKLKAVAEDFNSSQEVRDEANRQMLTLVENSNKEKIIEQLLLAKNFENAVVMINGDSVNVVVQIPGNLSSVQTAQIADIVTREAKVDISNVHIIPKN